MATDYTPIGPVPSGIANGTVDATSKQLARDMRGKAYGKDVRETMARMTEWHSIRSSASEVLAAQSAASAKNSAQEVTQNAQNAIKLLNEGIRDITTEYALLRPQAISAIVNAYTATERSVEALNTANGIDAKATEALSKSTDADTLSKSVQSQFNQVVIDGDSSVEAAQARVDASGHTNATLKERLDKEYNEVTAQLAQIATNVTSGGAKGNGVDETSLIQSVFNVSKYVLIPYGTSFKVTTLTIPDNTIIFGYGAKIYSDTHQSVLKLGNGVKIYGLEIQGAGNTTHNALGKGIEIKGEYNSTLQTIAYKSDILLENCYIHDFGAYGIYAEYAKNVRIVGGRIKNVGYAGLGGLSVDNVHVSNNCHIKNISPGENSNAYGVFFSRSDASTNLTQYPKSKNCSVVDCVIENNLIWEGLDTHAGENITFDRNTILNCKIGIAIVNSGNYAPKKATVSKNRMFGIGEGNGIILAGKAGTVQASVDSLDLAIIEGNHIEDFGKTGDNLSSALSLVDTKGAIIRGNTLRNNRENGIFIYNTNFGFVISDNIIEDVYSNTFSAAPCISVRSDYNKGTIKGNITLRTNTGLATYVSERGLSIGSATNNELTLIEGYSTCPIKILGGRGQSFSYGSLGENRRIYSGAGSPEGVITAAVGSVYYNLNGGVGTTQYVKESGSGNTGWSGK